MKLTYRGVSYEYTPPAVEFNHSNTVGKYRGLDLRFRNPKKAPVLQPTLDLMYRGVSHSTAVPQVEEVVAPVVAASNAEPAKASVLTIQDRARSLMMNRHRSVKRRQQAMLSRLDAEVGISADEASRFWNHIQGQVHPSFWATYERSHATIS